MRIDLILWSHIFGGSSNTRANAVAVDNEGNVYVAGTTGARDFPLMKPVQDKQTGLNIAFLMKFNSAGQLQFSTYLGGDRNEEGLAVAVDSQQNIRPSLGIHQSGGACRGRARPSLDWWDHQRENLADE